MNKAFLQTLSLSDALDQIRDRFEKILPAGESRLIAGVLGHTAAQDLFSPIDSPPFDRSRMDGFAIWASDSFGADEESPVTLTLREEKIFPGLPCEIELKTGQAAEIATGAQIPKGCSGVVPLEYCQAKGPELQIYRSIVPNENLQQAGSDIMAGELVLVKGERITSQISGMLASIGIAELLCYPKPRVAVISTGNELRLPGETLKPGEIYDANARILCDLITETGGEAHFLGMIPDEWDPLAKALLKAQAYDVIVFSGGTSKSSGDLTYQVIDALCQPGIFVHGVMIRPGKPIAIALWQNKPVFVLPGFPTSALVTFHVFVKPLIHRLAGLPDSPENSHINGYSTKPIRSPQGLDEFVFVNLVHSRPGLSVYPIIKPSGAITAYAKADGYIHIPAAVEFIEANAPLDVHLLKDARLISDLVIIGSHCLGLEILMTWLRSRHRLSIKAIWIGSLAGLEACRNEEADIAPIHLLDDQTGQYNKPFIYPNMRLLRGYRRQQGILYSLAPPQIPAQGFADWVSNPDLTFINRNQGSGTRVLVDKYLAEYCLKKGLEMAKMRGQVKGYFREAYSHNAVAAAIFQKKADWGIGIEAMTSIYPLQFQPLKEEAYDFGIPESAREKPAIKAFIAGLQAKEFQQALYKNPGFIIPEGIGEWI